MGTGDGADAYDDFTSESAMRRPPLYSRDWARKEIIERLMLAGVNFHSAEQDKIYVTPEKVIHLDKACDWTESEIEKLVRENVPAKKSILGLNFQAYWPKWLKRWLK